METDRIIAAFCMPPHCLFEAQPPSFLQIGESVL
jgi:hypothetical protein